MHAEVKRSAQGTCVNARVPRKEDRRFLTGRDRYVDNVQPSRNLYAAFLRSPYTNATTTRIDCAPALHVDGVVAVFDARSLLLNGWVAKIHRRKYVATEMPILADGRVRHQGELVALVVAARRRTALGPSKLTTSHLVYVRSRNVKCPGIFRAYIGLQRNDR